MIRYLKPNNCVWIINIRKEYLKPFIRMQISCINVEIKISKFNIKFFQVWLTIPESLVEIR